MRMAPATDKAGVIRGSIGRFSALGLLGSLANPRLLPVSVLVTAPGSTSEVVDAGSPGTRPVEDTAPSADFATGLKEGAAVGAASCGFDIERELGAAASCRGLIVYRASAVRGALKTSKQSQIWTRTGIRRMMSMRQKLDDSRAQRAAQEVSKMNDYHSRNTIGSMDWNERRRLTTSMEKKQREECHRR